MRVLVVGAGASGLSAAVAAGMAGAEVEVIEKSEKAGKKIYLTGKGRCNVTNDAGPEEFISSVFREPKFFYSAFRAFSNRDLMDLLEGAGCPLTVERGGRVFPSSGKASDITKAWLRLAGEAGVKIRLNTSCESLWVEDGELRGVVTGAGRIASEAVILACGGLSYPSTGSTGDGYALAAQAGHTLDPTKPALTGMISGEEWVRRLSGVALRAVTLRIPSVKGCEATGELLFTRTGLSGPAVLTLSCLAPAGGGFDVVCDLRPRLESEEIIRRIASEAALYPTKEAGGVLDSFVPKSLARALMSMRLGDPAKKLRSLTGRDLETLAKAIKELVIPVSGLEGYGGAVITDGGVPVREINPRTMESRLLKGLYICGEMINMHAFTGGFNLQLAFSTGHVAGESAAS